MVDRYFLRVLARRDRYFALIFTTRRAFRRVVLTFCLFLLTVSSIAAGRGCSYRRGGDGRARRANMGRGRYGRNAGDGYSGDDSGPTPGREGRTHSAVSHAFAAPNAINRQAARHCSRNRVDDERERLRNYARSGRRSKRCRIRQDACRVGDNPIDRGGLVFVRTTIGPAACVCQGRACRGVVSAHYAARGRAYRYEETRRLVSFLLADRISENLSCVLNFFEDNRYVSRGRAKGSRRGRQDLYKERGKERRRVVSANSVQVNRVIYVNEGANRERASGIGRIVPNGYRDRQGDPRRGCRLRSVRPAPIRRLRRRNGCRGATSRRRHNVLLGPNRHF